MKSKIILTLIAIATLMSCHTETHNSGDEKEHETRSHEDAHESHGSGDIVVLTKSQREALNLKLGTFQMRNLTTVIKSNGQLKVPPASSAEVTAIIGGKVKEIKVFHGDKVRKGQPLAVLEHPDYIALQENFAEAFNRLEFLTREFQRQKELFDNNIGAGKDFQQVKADYYTAKAKYAGLKSRLELLNLSPDEILQGNISSTITIKSPINGFINDVKIKVGAYVGTTDVLFEITDNSAIHADFLVYEKDVHLVKKGQKVHFTISNRHDKEFMATIFAVGKEFEANSRAVHIHAKINGKVTDLIPGIYISGHIHTDKQYTRTLPEEALVTEGTKSFIFIADNAPDTAHEHHETGTHDHDADGSHEEAVSQNHDEKDHDHAIANNEDDKSVFRKVEVIKGITDAGYTEVKLINPLPENTQIVMNGAYYLLADMKKEEAEHEH